MNYDQPREIAAGPHAGKWQYTRRNDGNSYPIGYCWAPGDDGDLHDPATWTMHYHDTEFEARECYGTYLRDNTHMRANALGWTDCSVKGCENPANNLANTVGGWHTVSLCDNHFDPEHAWSAMGILGAAGDSMHS